MSIKCYVLGGPRYKPLGVSRGSPRLHFIIMFMLMLYVVVVVTEIKFNSTSFLVITLYLIFQCQYLDTHMYIVMYVSGLLQLSGTLSGLYCFVQAVCSHHQASETHPDLY